MRVEVPKASSESVRKVMLANRGKHTSPELIVRKALSSIDVRGYRLHPKNIPGRPDVSFRKSKVAVIINGCFWHGCTECGRSSTKSNKKYWSWKMRTNRARDKRNLRSLIDLGWKPIVIWEHDIKKGRLPAFALKIKKAVKKR